MGTCARRHARVPALLGIPFRSVATARARTAHVSCVSLCGLGSSALESRAAVSLRHLCTGTGTGSGRVPVRCQCLAASVLRARARISSECVSKHWREECAALRLRHSRVPSNQSMRIARRARLLSPAFNFSFR